MNKTLVTQNLLPSIRVDVVEPGVRARRNWVECVIGQNLMFDTKGLESYCLATWEPLVYDALVVAAAVQFCDHTRARPAKGWSRDIVLQVAVHDPARWSSSSVSGSLHQALNFLTGDRWTISFSGRREPVPKPRQGRFNMPDGSCIVIPFSEGLDSFIVLGLMEREHGDRLIPVRVGSKSLNRAHHQSPAHPFASVPYHVQPGEYRFAETSARSRGFKFAFLSGIAAYLSGADQIIVPESGQGALGTYLVPVGQTYEDYRNHPLFTARMEAFLVALFGHQVRFTFPRLWHTKGETLGDFVAGGPGSDRWTDTRSCWQSNRHVSVFGRAR